MRKQKHLSSKDRYAQTTTRILRATKEKISMFAIDGLFPMSVGTDDAARIEYLVDYAVNHLREENLQGNVNVR